jgi:tetratricopeptide (TPR) repeat protein
MIASEPQAAVPKPSRWRTVRRWLVLSLLVAVALVILWEVTGYRKIATFRDSIATADRIVVRDGGFNCCGPVDDEVILFEVTDPSEIEAVVTNLTFAGSQSPCNCCGFPGIDWYRGEERVALTAIQHGKAVRWGGSDLRLSETSRQWLTHWLVGHGVKEEEIEGGCGGPRRNLRRHAARMKLAQACVTRGETHTLQGDLDAAIADFTEAIEHDVNFARAHYLRGLAHEKKGEFDQAIRDFTAAIWFTTPFIKDSRAEAAKFITDSTVPVELDGDLGMVHYARGRVFQKNGDKVSAENDFAQAKKLGFKPK